MGMQTKKGITVTDYRQCKLEVCKGPRVCKGAGASSFHNKVVNLFIIGSSRMRRMCCISG